MFKKLYLKVILWASHKYSIYYLAFLSMVESFILPYPPPDILLAPMVLKSPIKAYRFAAVCTIFSIIGGIIGYLIGYFALDLIIPILEKLHYLDKLATIKIWFQDYGILIVFVAGFSPMPYKIFTLGAGAMSLAFIPFVLISFLSRGLRFFLVAYIIKKSGDKFDILLQKYIEPIGYGIIIFATLFIIYKTI